MDNIETQTPCPHGIAAQTILELIDEITIYVLTKLINDAKELVDGYIAIAYQSKCHLCIRCWHSDGCLPLS